MKRAFVIILCSFVFLIVGGLAFGAVTPFVTKGVENVMGVSLFVIFGGLFVWGTGTWAQAKGHPMLLGVILGWLGPLGLLILVLLKDRSQVTND